MNVLCFSTKRNGWLLDFLVLIFELMVACLPKRLRLLLESTYPSALIDLNQEIFGIQSSDFNRGEELFVSDKASIKAISTNRA